MGSRVIDGIVFHLGRRKATFRVFVPGPQSQSYSYKGVSPKKAYTFPVYNSSDMGESDLKARIPDYRDQLFWNPEIKVGSEDVYNIEFFTSDTKGQFEVVVEGITKEGKSVSIRKYFVVE